jgi:hypothetical protein
MMQRMKPKLAVGVVLLAISACSQSVQPKRIVTLPSGKKIRVLDVVQWKFSNGAPALMLKYETDLKVSDLEALKQEVAEIWPEFRKDVENGKFEAAIISANEVPQGFIVKRSNAYNFVYERQADGSWRLSK